MSEVYNKLLNCVKEVRKKTDFIPHTAVVLGSGLGGFADGVKTKCVIPFHEIKSFPVSTVSGHQGRFIFCSIAEVPVVIMQGRVHYYEGYSMEDVVLPVRLMGLMGAKTLLLTNAGGGINQEFCVGDLMMITGQITSFVPSPLIGANIEALGKRFPDMSHVYDRSLQSKLEQAAKNVSVNLKRGVYLQTTGPNYETPEEIKMYERLGADAVGMSTACEAMAAHHMGLAVCGISCISNMAAGVSKTPLSHEEVQKTTAESSAKFKALLNALIPMLAEEDHHD